MNNRQYYKILSNLIENALLHLYGQIAQTERFVPVMKRNEILVRFLKLRSKQHRYQALKTEFKRMLIAGRNKNGNLEVKLLELNQLAKKFSPEMNDTQRLFDLLKLLQDEHGFDSKLYDEKSISEPEIIYVFNDHIEHCFDEHGNQTAPVSLLLDSKKAPSLIKIIVDTGLFNAEMKEFNTGTFQGHIIIHPVEDIIK